MDLPGRRANSQYAIPFPGPGSDLEQGRWGWADVDRPLISFRSSQSCTILANMTEDERLDLLRTVSESHASLSAIALKLRLQLPPKAPALKTAIKAERGAFHLKRTLQQLVVEDLEHVKESKSLPEVRLGLG